jgi:glycosyltransferase involved in cell wall biosynthesis
MRPDLEAGDREDPLVSVVIPTYGRDEMLQTAIESVINQTYEPIELLIVDDGSPKPVAGTLQGCAFEELHSTTFIRHNENRGANQARISGIRAAAGRYIAFLDDDDRWATDKISRQVAAFETSDEEVGVVYTGKRTTSPHGSTETRPSVSGDVTKALLAGESFGQFSAVMVRADVIDEAGLPDERFPAWQDREWFLRLSQVCQFEVISEPLTYRRAGHGDRITAQFEQRREVAYPLFVEKHYSTAREYGIYYARMFLASLRTNLASSAVRANRYGEARKYYLLAFLANPFYQPVYKYLLATLCGERSYQAAARMRKKFIAARSLVGNVQKYLP